jgi:hypothetical protein
MRKTTQIFLMIAIALITAGALIIGEFRWARVAEASSHREAPLISKDQYADNTDVYAFRSPDRPDTVTLIANFIPFEEPSAGPNFYKFDNTALYQIRLDNNNDARLDLAIQFRFRNQVLNPNTFLYNTGTIENLDDPDWNVRQVMDVTALIRQGDPNTPTFTTFNVGTGLRTPPVNIGPRSTPNYENLAQQAINNIGGVRIFAGQRDDSFYIDTGAIFDLLGLRPFNPAHVIPRPQAIGVDFLAHHNVHTIAIQVPIQLLTANAQVPTDPNDPNAILGVYSTVSRPGMRVLNTNGTVTTNFEENCSPANTTGVTAQCPQVSRLANPLFNELFIPRGSSEMVSENDKDLYNAQLPATDVNRIDFVRGTAARPVEPVALINFFLPTCTGCADYESGGSGDGVLDRCSRVTPSYEFQPYPAADLMRLNVAIPPTAFGSQNRLGVIGGDLAGYPNGRRPTDDVTDITLRAAAGVLLGNACQGGANCIKRRTISWVTE